MVGQRKAAFAEESAEVEVLYANLEKLKGLTKKIQGSLNRLETSGKTVEDAIAPIYGSTQRLQTTNRNIDNVIEVIDRLRKPLDQRDREDRIIRTDPRDVGIADYIASMDRATRALAGLQSSPLQTNQKAITELSALLRFGAKQLEQVFRDILREESRAVEPMQYMAKGKPFPTITDSNSNQLRQIHTHVTASILQTSPNTPPQDFPTAKVYAEIRGEYIATTARTLGMASINTGRKMNADQLYQPGTNTLPMYTDGLKQLAETEYNNVSPIFRSAEWKRICAATMRQPLAEFAKTMRDLNTQIQSNLMTDCFLAYEIIGIVQKLAMDLERLADLKQTIMDALKPVRETARISMSKMIQDIRDTAQSLVSLPADGGAIPITADVMTRLQTMTRLLDPVTSVLMDLGDGGWNRLGSVQSLDVRPNGEQLFADYARDTVDALLNALDGRARVLLKSSAVQGVFMVNNIAVVNRMIQSSELQPLLANTAPQLLEPWNKKCSRRYMDSWQEICRLLFDQQNTRSIRPSSGGTADSASIVKSLGSKEKEAIKEKFKQFNIIFDDLIAKHRGYSLEREVRAQFVKEITSMIEPLYRRFWDKYHEIDKGKGKYVKYDKAQMSSVLAGLG